MNLRPVLRVAERTSHNITVLASGLIVAALMIAFLLVGREILLPLVLATLLAFILAPVIRRLGMLGVWKAPAVVLTVVLAIGGLAGLGYTIALQITQLAEDLPKYQSNLSEKVRALSGSPAASSTLDRAAETLRKLENEIGKPAPSSGETARQPVLVEVRQPQPTGLEAIANLMRPLLSPLTTSALVILFLLFILLSREDLRDRFLRLLGTADLQRSTAALDDAGSRLSRFFLMQTLLNMGFGVVIGIGLAFIGVPNPVLWGILAGLMRFVPFIGGFIAAFFPILLAAAVDPGWTMVLLTVGLFVVAEPLAGHVVEPVLYGQHTGLSPVAIVVATLFWTVLWGPIGLLLATPLTVCLVVLGRHIEALHFIEVLLGDEPALAAHERFYQRLLASDATEAADQAEEQLKTQPLSAYYDAVPMQALMLAQVASAHGKLAREKQLEVRDTIEEVVEDLADQTDELPDGAIETSATIPTVSRAQWADDWQMPYPVLCVGSRSSLDEAACLMLAHVLERHGVPAWVQPFADVASAKNIRIDVTDARLVCLSYFGSASKPAHVRFLIRRLKRLLPDAKFLAGFWMLGEGPEKVEEWRKSVGADFAATSLIQAASIVMREAVPKRDPVSITGQPLVSDAA